MTNAQDPYPLTLKLFEEHVEAATRVTTTLAGLTRKLAGHYPFQPEAIAHLSDEVDILIAALFKKYEQLAVLLNDNILKHIPYLEMENMVKTTRYDTILFAEKVGVVKAAKGFVDAVALRNQLAHEYPLDPAKQAHLVNKVLVESEVMMQTMTALRAYVAQRLPVWRAIRKDET